MYSISKMQPVMNVGLALTESRKLAGSSDVVTPPLVLELQSCEVYNICEILKYGC